MNRLTDLEINCAVRKVLVRHWIDLGKISIRTIAGVTTLSGALDKLPKVDVPLTSSSVGEIIAEIRRAPAVKRVQAVLSNWTELDRMWKPVASKTVDISLQAGKLPAASAPLDLTEEWIEINQKNR
jgi:hypothetical protein